MTQFFTLLLINNAMDSTCSSIFQPLYRPASRGTCLTPKKALLAHPKSFSRYPFFIVHSQSNQGRLSIIGSLQLTSLHSTHRATASLWRHQVQTPLKPTSTTTQTFAWNNTFARDQSYPLTLMSQIPTLLANLTTIWKHSIRLPRPSSQRHAAGAPRSF